MSRLKSALTRLHLWIGESLGLTHYRNCHGCRHCRDFEDLGPAFIGCDLYLEEDCQLAITDPCEAVWCDEYEEGEETWH